MPRPIVSRLSSSLQNTRSLWRALFLFPTVDFRGARASILRWALAGGIVVLLGTGLLHIFSGALPGAASAPPSHPTPQSTVTSLPWSATVLTTDRLILVMLEVDPNQTGTNI